MKKSPRISIIVAIDQRNGIGKNNELLCRISDDLKRFKKITTGNTVVMGRKTFESLPNGALPNRTNIVITQNKNFTAPNCIIAHSVADSIAKMDVEKENFIIGGAEIYALFLPLCQKIYLTQIHQTFNADCFFPAINFDEWNTIENTPVEATDSSPSYSFLLLERK